MSSWDLMTYHGICFTRLEMLKGLMGIGGGSLGPEGVRFGNICPMIEVR